MASASSAKRVLVHLKSAANNQTNLCKFTDCVVDILSPRKNSCDQTYVKCELQEEKLTLTATSPEQGVLLKHPPFCPIARMTSSEESSISPDDIKRGVNVGVVALLETSDRHVLLTRRAPHMRTFPGVWVPPGGGIDEGENLIQTALRELCEETGLFIETEIKSWHVLCLWESVYPPVLTMGSPKRHHIVVYLHILSKASHLALQKRLQLDPNEVDAAAWIDKTQVDFIVNDKQNNEDIKKTFVMTVMEKGKQEVTEHPLSALSGVSETGEGLNAERISTGTQFALSRWLVKCLCEQKCNL